MALNDLVYEKNQLTAERARIKKQCEDDVKRIDKRLCEVAGLIESGKLGFDTDRIERAKKLVEVGKVETNPRKECVQRFIKYLTEDAGWLKENYCGVKIYSGFGEQHEDHRKGYGPRHGSIVFRVELKVPSLSDSEREDVLWYLLNIEKIQEAEKVVTNA